MFGFKKKEKDNSFYSPVSGELIDLEKVSDKVFSSKMMGQGYAVIPSENEIVSPVNGRISMISKKTKHAIGITMDNGLEILVHMGVNTVELNGEPFNLNVYEGQIINHGEIIAKMNRNMIKENDFSDVVMVLITNSNDKGINEIHMDNKSVKSNEKINILN